MRENLHRSAEGNTAAKIFSIKGCMPQETELSLVSLVDVSLGLINLPFFLLKAMGQLEESIQELFLSEQVVF